MDISKKIFWIFCLFTQTYSISNNSDCFAQEGSNPDSRFHRIEPIKCVFPYDDECVELPNQNQTRSTSTLICGLSEIWKGFTTKNEKARAALSHFRKLSELSPEEQLTAIKMSKFDFSGSNSISAGITAAEALTLGHLQAESSYLKNMAIRLTKNWYNYILLSKQNNAEMNKIRATLRKELVEECGEQSIKSADNELIKKYRESQEKYVLDEIGRVEPPQDLNHQNGFSAWNSKGPKNFYLSRFHDPSTDFLAYLQIDSNGEAFIQEEVFHIPQKVSFKKASNFESLPIISKKAAFEYFGKARKDFSHPEILIFDLTGLYKGEPNIFHLDLLFNNARILTKYRVRGPYIEKSKFQTIRNQNRTNDH